MNMRTLTSISAAIIVLVFAGLIYAAGTSTITDQTYAGASVHEVRFIVLSDSAGNVHGAVDTSTAGISAFNSRGSYTGTITGVYWIPAPTAGIRPNDGMDLYIYVGSDTLDILGGSGVNIDTTGATNFTVVTTNKIRHPIVGQSIRIDIDSMAHERVGTLVIHIER